MEGGLEIKIKPEKPKLLKHLNEGVKPIYASLMSAFEDPDVIDPETGKPIQYSPENISDFIEAFKKRENVQEVSWFAEKEKLDREGFLHGGVESYVISPINDSDKFSEGYNACTGLVVSGIDKKTGKNISFISHQATGVLVQISMIKEKFQRDLDQRLREIKEMCVEGTVDAVLVGGDYFYKYSLEGPPLSSIRYERTTEILMKPFMRNFDFEPTIINGPKVLTEDPAEKRQDQKKEHEDDDIYFDNEERRLYFIRTKINQASLGATSGDFKPSELEGRKKDWV